MRIVTLLFSILLAAAYAWFSARNWMEVTLNLTRDLVMVLPLPLLLGVFALVLILPMMVLHGFVRWGLRRRISRLEKMIVAKDSEIATLRGRRGQVADPLPSGKASTTSGETLPIAREAL